MISSQACVSLKSWTSRSNLVIAALVVALLLGCGGATGQDPLVSGAVTLDSLPLESGTVIFQPDDASVAPQMAQIEEGQFSLRVKAGKYRVVIEASRRHPDVTGKHGEPIYASQIPERYNRKTNLSATVVSDGANDLTFDLESGV